MLSTLGADGPDAGAALLLWALYFCARVTESDPGSLSTPYNDDGSVATVQPAVAPVAELAWRCVRGPSSARGGGTGEASGGVSGG